jgi:hypothetical protein
MRARRATCILSSLLVAGLSCKTRRPVVDLEDAGTNSDQDQRPSSAAYVKVDSFNLPLDPKPYTRVSLHLIPQGKPGSDGFTSPAETIAIENYKLGSSHEIEETVRYEMIVSAYQNGHKVYSNIYCKKSRFFTARLGPNTFTTPLCDVPAGTDADEGRKTGTPAAPGGS